MKKNYIFLVLMLLMVIRMQAQNLTCSMPALTVAQRQSLQNTPLVSTPAWSSNLGSKIKIKIQFFIVCPGDVNTASLTPAQVSNALSVLNTKFSPANIEFVQCAATRYVKHEPLSNNFPFANTLSEDALGKNDLRNTINVYIVNTIAGSLGGYTWLGNINGKNKIYLACMTSSGSSAHLENGLALSHEMGHFFGLGHTNGFSTIPGTTELVNGSNSSTAGDLIQDTPADPCYMNYSSSATTPAGPTCTYPFMALFQPSAPCGPVGYPSFCDANNQRYSPLGNNLMISDYSLSFNTLTAGQLQRIYSTYLNNFVGDFDGGADLVIRDNINDGGDQMGLFTDWANVFQSPDVWNCNTSDNCTAPEFAGYGNTAADNYIRINVTNKGCANSTPAKVHAYWTLGSTGEDWPASWSTTTYCGNLPGGGEIRNADSTYGQNIPTLAPNQQMTFTFPWKPVNPNDYTCMQLLTNTNGAVTICYLGRIESVDEPMYSEQNGPIQHNVIFNNNIATHNSSLVRLSGNRTGRVFGKDISVLIQNPMPAPYTYDIHINNTGNTDYFQNGAMVLTLSDGLWQAWVNGGQRATGVEVHNAAAHQVSVTGNNAMLQNVLLLHGNTEVMLFSYYLKSMVTGYKAHSFVVYQTESGHNTDALIGSAYNFKIDITPDIAAPAGKEGIDIAKSEDWAMLYPNPVSGRNVHLMFSLTEDAFISAYITDQSGKKVMTVFNSKYCQPGSHDQEIDLHSLAKGAYFLNITDSKQHQVIKLIIN